MVRKLGVCIYTSEYLFIYWPCPPTCEILVPNQESNEGPTKCKQSPKHCTTREFHIQLNLMVFSNLSFLFFKKIILAFPSGTVDKNHLPRQGTGV